MQGLSYKNPEYQLRRYQQLSGLLNREQERNHSSNSDKFPSAMKIIEENQTKKRLGYECDTLVRQINEHAYLVSFDQVQQGREYHPGQSTLTDIHADFHRNKENLVTDEGFIHVKEYALDGYTCRCHEHNDLLYHEKIDNARYLFDYRLKF